MKKEFFSWALIVILISLLLLMGGLGYYAYKRILTNIYLSDLSFYDPTNTLKLNPKIYVNGRNHTIYVYDENFEGYAEIKGGKPVKDGKEVKRMVLKPKNDGFVLLTKEETSHVINFLTDFLRFSRGNSIDFEDRGFPKQFYLYTKDRVISLGDMLFLVFEEKTYDEMGINNRVYFIPKNQSYQFVNSSNDIKDSYRLSLLGHIPKQISKNSAGGIVYNILLGNNEEPGYDIKEINIKRRGIDIAFAFDIESGRYIHNASGIGISPCKDSNYSLGLGDNEKICNNPAYVAWMSPRDSKIVYTQYPYPHVSGLLGFIEILNYSERYGIPTTNYIVKKDIVAFNTLDKEVVDRAKSLVNKGLIEIGSHTRYHTNLGLVDEDTAKKEINESKLFLEGFFNTIIIGFRPPYLSVPKNDSMYIKALEEAGYSYYSQFGGHFGKTVGDNIVSKPWNSGKYLAYTTPHEFKKMMEENPYLITLDHPWNMVYQDGNVLVEDTTLPDTYRAIILTAISNGGIPVMVKDIKQ